MTAKDKNVRPEVLQWREMTRRHQTALICLLILTLEYVIHYYIEIGIVPKGYVYINAAIAVFLPIFSFVSYRKYSFRPYPMALFIGFFIILMYTLVLSGFDGHFSRDIVCVTIYLQILTAVLYEDIELKFLEKLFLITAIIATIGFIYAILSVNIDVTVAIKRGYQYQEIFYYSSLFWCVTPFVICALLRNRCITFSIIYAVLNVILQMVIVKRMILLQTAVLVLVSIAIILTRKRTKEKVKALIGMLSLVLCAIVLLRIIAWDTLMALSNSVIERTLSASDDIGSFDRFVESKNYLSDATALDIIIGKGFGGTHTGGGVVAEALHVGWCNFLLKGGVLLVVLMIIPYFKIIALCKQYQELSIEIKFAFWYLISMFPMLFLTNMHCFYPQMFLYVYCCIKIMNYRKCDGAKYEVMDIA